MTIKSNFFSGNTFSNADSFFKKEVFFFFFSTACTVHVDDHLTFWQPSDSRIKRNKLVMRIKGLKKTVVETESTAFDEVDNFDNAFHYRFHLRWYFFWCQYSLMNKEIIPNNVKLLHPYILELKSFFFLQSHHHHFSPYACTFSLVRGNHGQQGFLCRP